MARLLEFAHHQRVAVGGSLGRDVEPEIAAGARPIVDHHLPFQRFAELVGQKPRQRVGAATGRAGHDETDRLVGPGLRLGAGAWRGQRENREQQADDPGHALSSGDRG